MATNAINIRRFVDVTTSVQETPTQIRRDWGAVLFVQKGTDGQTTALTKYNDLTSVIEGAGSNTEAAKFATALYNTSYRGVSLNSPIWVAVIGAADEEQFTTNFSALLGSEEYFYIALDSNFADSVKKTAATLAGASETAHKLVLDDMSANAFDLNLEDDLALGADCSVSAFVKSNSFSSVATVAINPSNTNKYYSASYIAFYATRTFTPTATQMCSINAKPAQGVQPVDMTDSALSASVDIETRASNLVEKNASVYANIKLVGLVGWYGGKVGSGDELCDVVSADYLQYTVTMAVFNLLQTTPRLAMNANGASRLATVLSTCFDSLAAAGVIGGGVSMEGEIYPESGYKFSIPIPTGVAKANGLWEGITCSALLIGQTRRVVILNDLVK